ncbi:DUF3349 domain-containing protein [Nostoc sp. FACHB-152]|uniref:DUF3349 domain-containing protein n=1 Tax=unclassified Nostoc TaxID=2593658 RepID=UPI00168A11EA|nr:MULTISPECIES: DUF3349 domain-containing protein [unclassified Nostoc]MBD2450134.1 DUF3349 domain-containing protein [Nostoc sp. FACHB-152]MBD2471317.1 DUF3349 domain-containing protein [Nostoc sp. FACHB-145]
MQITIPPHLQSTYRLIQCAFPNGIEEENYEVLLALLSEEMSDRNVAEVIAYYIGKDYSVVLNDVYRVQSVDIPKAEDITKLKQLLVNCGYQKWIDE